MFSVIFPGQGSQIIGMGKEFYDKFEIVKNLFKEADNDMYVKGMEYVKRLEAHRGLKYGD